MSTKGLRILEQKQERVNIGRALVEVVLMDCSKETISVTGFKSPLTDWSISAENRLDFYLKTNKVYVSDSGVRIPVCSVVKMLPMRVDDYYVIFEITKYRDWNMFPFGISSWSEKEIARGV